MAISNKKLMKKGFIAETILVGLAILAAGVVVYTSQGDTVLGANQKVSELTNYTAPTASDVLPIVDTANSETKKITLPSIFGFLNSTTTYTSILQTPLIKAGSGSSLAPSITFTNDTGLNTGLYLEGQNILGFSAGGTEVEFTSTAFRPGSDLSVDLGSATQRWNTFHAVLATTTSATTTNFYVSGRASSTDLRANTANIGSATVNGATVNNLTVTGTCSGCSAAGVTTFYNATRTAATYMAKTLTLTAGDSVKFCGGQNDGSNFGNIGFRISSPWQVSTTTILNDTSVGDDPIYFCGNLTATTTSTYTFEYSPGGGGSFSQAVMDITVHGSAGFTNQF